MADRARLAELDQQIAAVRENIGMLTEQAAAYSGAADEARNADRIAEQDLSLQGCSRSERHWPARVRYGQSSVNAQYFAILPGVPTGDVGVGAARRPFTCRTVADTGQPPKA